MAAPKWHGQEWLRDGYGNGETASGNPPQLRGKPEGRRQGTQRGASAVGYSGELEGGGVGERCTARCARAWGAESRNPDIEDRNFDLGANAGTWFAERGGAQGCREGRPNCGRMKESGRRRLQRRAGILWNPNPGRGGPLGVSRVGCRFWEGRATGFH